MNTYSAVLLASCLALAGSSGCTSSPKPKPSTSVATAAAVEQPLRVEDSVDVTLTSKVKTIDYSTRVVTLEDEAGNRSTFVAGRQVKRLDEVKVGDNVKARYTASILAELRAPTPEEAAHPIAAVDIAGRAPRSGAPAGGAAGAFRIVATVEAVDLPNLRITLRGPMGDLAVVQGRKPENVMRVKVGDTIVITYAEAVAISLEKALNR